MSSCACRIVAQCRALRDSDTAHSESGDAEISQAHLCRQRRRLWDWSSQSRRSAVLKEHCLLAQAQLARAVRRRRHLLTETMRDAAHLCFCAIRECKGTRVKVPERASCRARVCILHFSSAHLQGQGDFKIYRGRGIWTKRILFYSILHSVTYAGYHPRECHPQNPHTTHHPQHSQQVQMQSWARCTAAASSSSTPPPLGWSGNRRHEMLTHVQASLLHLRREDKRERHWGR